MIFQDKNKIKFIVSTLLAFAVALLLCLGIMKIREIYFSDIPKKYFALMVLPIFLLWSILAIFLIDRFWLIAVLRG